MRTIRYLGLNSRPQMALGCDVCGRLGCADSCRAATLPSLRGSNRGGQDDWRNNADTIRRSDEHAATETLWLGPRRRAYERGGARLRTRRLSREIRPPFL